MSQPASDDRELAGDALLGPLFAQTEAEERAVLNGILTAGLDQGWLLRPEDGELLRDASRIDAVLAVVNERPQAWPDQTDPWRDKWPQPPSNLGPGTGWVILTQRCDLLRAYALEPMVELARGLRITDAADARKARVNSARLISVDADDAGLWAVDMRTRAWLPKHRLPFVEAQPILASPIAHKRFRHRLGARYWRDAVPDDLRDGLAIPMGKAFSKGTRNRLLRHFSMLLGRRIGEQVMVLAVISPEASEDAAIEDWELAMTELARLSPEARAMVHPESEPVTEPDLSLAEWLDCFRFDFDDLTYGSKASDDQAPAAL